MSNRIDPAMAAEREFHSVAKSSVHARIVQAIENATEFLTPEEICRVADYAVYRGYLAARKKAMDRDQPIPTFEEFLVSFQEKKGLSK